MYKVYDFFSDYHFIYIYIFIYIFIFIEYVFSLKFNFFFKINKFNKIYWVEIWNIDTKISNLENLKGSPWNLYLKYKLSMINSWHILEERFLIFFIIILICFF